MANSSGNLPALTAATMKQAGALVTTVGKEFHALSQRAQAEDAMMISFERAALMMQLDDVFSRPEVAAVVLLMANKWGWIEVAHDDKKNNYVPDEKILRVCKQAVSMGLLLGDPAGPQFCVMNGKSVMPHIKEPGFRHKLKSVGATNLRLSVAVIGVEPRPNNAQQNDMLICGSASCTFGGKEFRVERSKDTPYRLQCWPSDGPDKNEGLAKRRLLRDLWAAVSGESIEDEEPEAPQQQAVTTIIHSDPAPLEGTVAYHSGLYNTAHFELQRYVNGITDDDAKSRFGLCVELIHHADSAEGLKARWKDDIAPALKELRPKAEIMDLFREACKQRGLTLEATR